MKSKRVKIMEPPKLQKLFADRAPLLNGDDQHMMMVMEEMQF